MCILKQMSAVGRSGQGSKMENHSAIGRIVHAPVDERGV